MTPPLGLSLCMCVYGYTWCILIFVDLQHTTCVCLVRPQIDDRYHSLISPDFNAEIGSLDDFEEVNLASLVGQ